jgi:mannose-6-phosphate isomerase class I
VPSVRTEAQALLEGDSALAHGLASRLIVPRKNNLVARPWGGRRMHEFKELARNGEPGADIPIGESFEIAAADDDPEAREHPSAIPLPDGSEVSLPELLEQHAETLFGVDFAARYGRAFPLLPKFLDVAELLSVQGHPEGNTEVYVIVAADDGATIRLGFAADVDGAALEAELSAGRADQQRLLSLFAARATPDMLQRVLKPWLATPGGAAGDLEAVLQPLLKAPKQWAEAARVLAALHALYWSVLERMNVIPVAAGQVIYNATPMRITALTGGIPSAEVHALGNPEGRELLALEIRRPGPTFRAWDNVRFPLRDIDIASAIGALNLQRTAPEEFMIEPRPVPGRAGVSVSIDCEHFRLEHLEPTAFAAVTVPAEPPHCLHVLEGEVSVYATDGVLVGHLTRGDSALVPVGVGAYRVITEQPKANVVKVNVPVGG